MSRQTISRQSPSRQMKWIAVAASGLALVVAAGRMQRVSWADEGGDSDAMKRLDRIVEKLDRIVEGMGRPGPGVDRSPGRPPLDRPEWSRRMAEMPPEERREWMEERMRKAKEKFQEMERRIERLEAEVAKLKRERE